MNNKIANIKPEPKKDFRTYLLTLLVCALLSGCGTSRAYLTLSDIDPRFEVLNDAGIQIILTDYVISDIVKYNEFFK